jgi:hypothetical protein
VNYSLIPGQDPYSRLLVVTGLINADTVLDICFNIVYSAKLPGFIIEGFTKKGNILACPQSDVNRRHESVES